MTRVAVVGHVEWVRFAPVAHLPLPGEVLHAGEGWEEAGGGGAVAVVQLAKLAGEADFYTALGDDDAAELVVAQLAEEGVRVHAVRRERPQRRVLTLLEPDGERTILVLDPRLAPTGEDDLAWPELAATDGAYFTSGDVGALEAARAARVLVATARARETLVGSGVRLDVLVNSGADPYEDLDAAALDPPPALAVRTQGAAGGRWEREDGTTGNWAAAPLPGPAVDAYGCGDSFHAALTFGLAAGEPLDAALALAARCGAACLTGRGPYAGQLRLQETA